GGVGRARRIPGGTRIPAPRCRVGLMIGRPAAEGAVLAALLAVFLCRAALASAIVPPWQGPDEPTHFTLTYGLTVPTAMHQRMEAGVLQSMVRHGWWDLYEDPPPDPLPSSLSLLFGI